MQQFHQPNIKDNFRDFDFFKQHAMIFIIGFCILLRVILNYK
jgi:hypothetical protein